MKSSALRKVSPQAVPRNSWCPPGRTLKPAPKPHVRHHIKPTKAMRLAVTKLVLAGYTLPDIAECIGPDGMTVQTLQKYFHKEVSTSQRIKIGNVVNSLYNQALGGNTTAAIFILKCRAGWKETPTEWDGKLEIVKRVIGVSEDEL